MLTFISTKQERKDPGMVSRADEGKELNIVPVSQISNGGFSEGNKGGD